MKKIFTQIYPSGIFIKRILLSILISLVSFNLWATHIIGGEMSSTYMGNDIYHVNLDVYRDCINGQAPFDNPAYIFVYDASNVLVETLNLAPLQFDTVPISLACAGIPPNICAERGHYEFDVTLPPSSGGYTLVYQRCCRSSIIGNLITPLEVGMTITTTIADTSLASDNNSPYFNNYPPTAFCVGIPISFDHSATDPDGDSLVYELCPGIAGADDINPQPFPALPPPYPEVTYLTPYSGTYPFDANPALAIDANSGLITGTPSSTGVFTLAVCVKEYRNGQLIGTHRREMAEVYTVTGVPVGIENEAVDLENLVYPIPASTELNINLNSVERIKEVNVYNLYGALTYTEHISSEVQDLTIPVKDFNNGQYLLELVKESGVQRQAFVVMK